MTSIPRFKPCRICGKDFPATLEFFFKSRNTDGLQNYCKECHRAKNRDNIRKLRHDDPNYGKDYYSNNREKVLKRTNENYHANRERYTNYGRRDGWVRSKNYTARKKNAEGSFTAQEIRDLMDWQNGVCFYCGADIREKYTADHYYPLAKGGSNWIHNIVLACTHCNSSKQDKLPHEFDPRCL